MKHTTPVFKKNQPDDSYKFRPLPLPTGKFPYHLNLSDVQPVAAENHLVFHMAGDTGSVSKPEGQQGVITAMIAQFDLQPAPEFLYHLGDLVYHFGEADQYAAQFFKPYENYPAPIFAIAGNHDTDVNPDNAAYESLAAFKTVFCDDKSRNISFSGGSARRSMRQPNIYWTLNTPVATFIGLHGNVPKFGMVSAEQRAWFIDELKAADPDKMLIVCVHHAPFSADTNHASSLYMIELLESAYREANVKPDIVFSGHVHNYQRFLKRYNDDEGNITYIVAGGGGFHEINDIATIEDDRFGDRLPLFKQVTLESYHDSSHGFLRIAISKTSTGVYLSGKYYAVTEGTTQTTVTDSFTVQKTLLNRFSLQCPIEQNVNNHASGS